MEVIHSFTAVDSNALSGQEYSITASHLLYRGASPAHFEDGAAGLNDGHEDQGGNAGNNNVELDVGINFT